MENGIEYIMVDLGLPSGLKWADRNVGAATPETIGDYFMWGSVTPDTDNVCEWAHAPFNYGSEKFDESYFNEHKSEWLTENGTLKSEYDAASVNMGEGWWMPTSVEIQELFDGTTLSVEKMNGVMGMRFTSKTNGNSIFMPLAGYRYDSGVEVVGEDGYAWSSSLSSGDSNFSRSLDFSSDGYVYVSYNIRCSGFVVRGVHE